MANDIATKHVRFSGRLLMLGCGSIGQGVLPLLLRHIDMTRAAARLRPNSESPKRFLP